MYMGVGVFGTSVCGWTAFYASSCVSRNIWNRSKIYHVMICVFNFAFIIVTGNQQNPQMFGFGGFLCFIGKLNSPYFQLCTSMNSFFMESTFFFLKNACLDCEIKQKKKKVPCFERRLESQCF